MEQKTSVFFLNWWIPKAGHMYLMLSMCQDGMSEAWDGILGHQFNKRLEPLAQYNSQSLLLAILKKTILFSGLKILSKKINKTRKLESIHK